MRCFLVLPLLALGACTRHAPAPGDAGPPPVISQDVLVRPVLTGEAKVQHILVGWAALRPNYGAARMDGRAAARDEPAAADVVRTVLHRLQAGEPFEKLMAEYSEDGASARGGQAYVVHPDGQMEPGFQAMALRLRPGEVGVCRTDYGYHVVRRLP